MRIFTLIVLVTLSITLFSQQNQTLTIDVDGVERSFILHFPTTSDQASGLPLVFNLHGYGSFGAQQQFYSYMDVIADAENFVICYPDGIDNGWNVGWNFGSTADDIQFISDVIDLCTADYGIDADRVYSCGMSNGGFMSYYLACNLSDRIAAIASVTGSTVPGVACPSMEAIPVLQIHGTADQTVLYDGSPINTAIPEVIGYWVDKNGCDMTAVFTPIADSNTTDNSTVEHFVYKNCDNLNAVELFKINGGAHTWPGAPIDIGGTNYDINASQEIWDFFKNFSKSGNLSAADDLPTSPSVTLSPNPATTLLNIQSTAPISQVIIYNSLGEMVLQGTNAILDISHLADGLYTVVTNNSIFEDKQILLIAN